ncbi:MULTISPECIES: DUF1266 domain-containing protein [unclassified Microbacterium]|uniref:DUF1266 domain-containing protein n=1 Tax=unclassified Microbacterium TaxID=2609290 RepID=UPI0038646422
MIRVSDVMHGLQNHPGDEEFPVRPRRRYVPVLDARRRTDKRERTRRALIVTAVALPFGIAGLVAVGPLIEAGDTFAFFAAFGFAMAIGLAVAATAMSFFDARAPRRAQQQYLQKSGRRALTLHQQQILALDAVSDYGMRGWNSSLAFTPSYAELPADMRARYKDGDDGSPWFALPIASMRQLRGGLDEQFKIVSKADAEMLAADMLNKGPLSQRFEDVAESDAADHMMSRVASLADIPVFDVLDLARGTAEHPPRLLLAADVERAIGGIRYAYVAGYLTADEAWALLDQIAAKAFAAYEGWDEYWRDVVVATAFRTDALDAVQQQRENVAKFRGSTWPAASLPFPRS